MKKHLLFTFALLLVQQFLFSSTNLLAQAPDFGWAHKGGGNGLDRGLSIAVDGLGNSYVTGSFSGSATFGSITLISNGGHDIYIAKYDASANVVWAKNGGGADNDTGWGIAIDPSGNSYITGIFSDVATFDNITLTSGGNADMFTAKYDASGNVVWVKNSRGNGNAVGKGLAIDASGDLYAIGYFTGSAFFGSITLNSSGAADLCLVKYDTAGNVLWAKNGGGAANIQTEGIGVDGFGNSYVTGFFSGNATFGSNVISAASLDMFIVKYDASGNVVWANKGGGIDTDFGYGIAVDTIGNSYVAGLFHSTATFSSISLISSGGSDMFIAKYDSSGNVVWVKKSGGVNSSVARGITIDGSGNLNVVGFFFGDVSFGNTMFNSSGMGDIFIARYDVLGNVIWAQKGGGTGNERGFGIAVDALGEVYVTGEFDGSTAFGSFTHTSSGNSDMFIAKLGSVVTSLEEEAVKGKMQVYPNPFTSTFNIALPMPTAEPIHIRITDVLGREVYRQAFTPDATGKVSIFPSKAFQSGLYHLQVQTAKATFTKKLMVE